ncbi:unnamed protein product, partial [Wuchereria bancrofti]
MIIICAEGEARKLFEGNDKYTQTYIRKHQAVERFSGKSWKGFWEDSRNKAVVVGFEVEGVQSRNDIAHPAGLDQ